MQKSCTTETLELYIKKAILLQLVTTFNKNYHLMMGKKIT